MSQKLVREKALQLRARLKSKKPKFRSQESWRYKRVSESWRKPSGIDSKMRSKLKGWPKSVDAGYRGPRKARSLHPSGYREVLVRNADDLAQVDPETQAARIAHSVGMKKRAEISLRAGERHIRILNPLPEIKPAKEAEEAEEAEDETVKEEGEELKETIETKPEESTEKETEQKSTGEKEKS